MVGLEARVTSSVPSRVGSQAGDRSTKSNCARSGLPPNRPLAGGAKLLWLGWLLATSLGWAVGWFVGATFYGETFGGFVSGGLGGSLGWIGQAAILSVVERRLSVYWALSSVAFWLAGLGLGMALSFLAAGYVHPTPIAIALGVLLTGVSQWLVLRSRVRRAGWWPIVLVLGFVVGGSAVSLVRLISGGAVLGGLGGAILGAGIGLTTGLAVTRLWRGNGASRST